MNAKKLALAAAITGALGAAGSAQAIVTGVAGEAMLVPLIAEIPGEANTFVQLYTPGYLGQDDVMNIFTAPNTTGGGAYTSPAAMSVHWYLFDQDSNHVCDGTFPMTPEDLADIWIGALGAGCFSGYGYAIFADAAAATGAAATFAMFADAQIVGSVFLDEHVTIPVMPMADGADTAGVGPRLYNEVTYETGPLSRIDEAAPIAAGIRMNDGSGAYDRDIVVDQVIHGDDGVFQTTHVWWFDRTNAARVGQVDVVDSAENRCSSPDVPLPHEVNLIMVEGGAVFTLTSNGAPTTVTFNHVHCDPTLGPFERGFFSYELAEIGDTVGGTGVTSAAVAFAIESDNQFGGGDLWMINAHDRGKF